MASRPPRWVLALVLVLMIGPVLLGLVIFATVGSAGWWFWHEMPGEEVASVAVDDPVVTLEWQGDPETRQTLWLSYALRGCTLEGVVDGHALRIVDGNPSLDGAAHARFLPSDEGDLHKAQVRLLDYPPGEEARSATLAAACAEPKGPVQEADLVLYVTNQR